MDSLTAEPNTVAPNYTRTAPQTPRIARCGGSAVRVCSKVAGEIEKNRKIVSAGTLTTPRPPAFGKEAPRGPPPRITSPDPPSRARATAGTHRRRRTKKGPGEGVLNRGENVSGMFPGTGPESGPNGGGIGVLWHHVMCHKTLDFIGFFVAPPAGIEPATPGLGIRRIRHCC